MRRFVQEHGRIVAFLLIVAVSALGFWRVESVRTDDVARSCRIEHRLWTVDHDGVLGLTAPIPLPPAVLADGTDNSYGLGRTKVRNAQLAAERVDLLEKLGEEPDRC